MSLLRSVQAALGMERTDGRTSILAGITSVQVPRTCADATQSHLRKMAQGGNEGIALWSGVKEESTFRVMAPIIPEQQGIKTSSGVCVTVGSDELHRLNVWLYKNRQLLVAQVHSHPGRAYHSAMDDQYAVVTAVGGLSLVVPDFAVRPFSVSDCAVYRLTANSRWTPVSRRQACSLIEIVEG